MLRLVFFLSKTNEPTHAIELWTYQTEENHNLWEGIKTDFNFIIITTIFFVILLVSV